MSHSQLLTPSTTTPAARSTAAPGHDRFLKVMSILAVLGFTVGLYMALVYAGPDAAQGNVQRIFYVHLGTFAAAGVAYMTAVFGGIAYLRTQHVRWDMLALSAVEVGLMLTVITVTTGMIWARPMWNTWWTWDPRMTSAAIVALTYGAYLMFRKGIENPGLRRKFASVYAILAIATVFVTVVMARVRPDTIHPIVIGPSAANAQGGFSMSAAMGTALGVNIVVWSLLITPVLIGWRVRLEDALEHVRLLQHETSEVHHNA